ncbi:class I SAM-dependent methyltransferase [Chitinophaga horti]|uniref:Class I SAM-dependent methyltransferase n=1 Tax=Chitinophaga horti TaxID=2920382 RepID=A0ABY6J8A2_9BACT|nr:class I SAM-dependent methyltransferase [Chitinophaga horti]UYQ95925.1 class I SAM-dependent methyltransferase [Chitinophaga horti]
MASKLSPRLAAIVDALPLRDHLRILEIGCGPGAAARAIVQLHPTITVLGIDRSAKAIQQAVAGSEPEVASGRLSFRQAAIEDFRLAPGEAPYDLVFAVRVGVLDGRHPSLEAEALKRIKAALVPDGRLFIDGQEKLNTKRL